MRREKRRNVRNKQQLYFFIKMQYQYQDNRKENNQD